jgi:hypothetical protein
VACRRPPNEAGTPPLSCRDRGDSSGGNVLPRTWTAGCLQQSEQARQGGGAKLHLLAPRRAALWHDRPGAVLGIVTGADGLRPHVRVAGA